MITRGVKGTHAGVLQVCGGFRFNTASDPTSFMGNTIASVVHTSTGVWTVTLVSALKNARGVISLGAPGLELDSSALTFLTWGKADFAAGTYIVRAYTESAGSLALADIAAGSNRGNWCHFRMNLKYGTERQGDHIT